MKDSVNRPNRLHIRDNKEGLKIHAATQLSQAHLMNILPHRSVIHGVLTALVCTSLLACSDPEDELVWLSPVLVHYSDAEPDWRYVARVSNQRAQFQLGGGADDDAFVVDEASGILRFVHEPDFKSPQDADANGIYEVGLIAVLDDRKSERMLKIEVLPSGTGAPQLSFPTTGSNLAAGSVHAEATLVRAEPQYRGNDLQFVSINGAKAELTGHGFWTLKIDYPTGDTALYIEAHYAGDIVTGKAVTVQNILAEPLVVDGEVTLDTNSAHQFMPESGNLYFLENGFLQRLKVRTGEQQQILGDFHSENRIVFGVNSAEDAVKVLDLGSPLTFPAQLTQNPDGREITISQHHLENGDEQRIPVQVQLERDPIMSAFQFDPHSGTFLIDERMYTSAFFTEVEDVWQIPLNKAAVNSDTGAIEVINQPAMLDSIEDIENPESDPINNSVSLMRVDMDWITKFSVGHACPFTREGIAFFFDPNLSSKWWLATQEFDTGFDTWLCDSYGLVLDPDSGLAYAAFYGYYSGDIVEIDTTDQSYRRLRPLWESGGPASEFLSDTFTLVHHMSLDKHNQVLYISSSEFTFDDARSPEETETGTLVKDRLWSYSLVTGGESVISESVYKVPTPSPFSRMYNVFTQRTFAVPETLP